MVDRGHMMMWRNTVVEFVVGASLLTTGAFAQVNLPDGFELVEFGVNDKFTDVPAINECGQIVYTKDFWENSRLFLYDNGRITQLTQYDNGRLVMFPDINNAGTIVWSRKPEGFESEVIMLRNGERTVIDDGAMAEINNHGDIAYEQFRGLLCGAPLNDIRVFNGRRSHRVYRSDWSDQEPIINDSGWITWFHGNFCVVPWVADLLLFNGQEVLDLLGESAQYGLMTLNDKGVVAWRVPNTEIHRHEIFLWENGQVRRLPVDASISGPQLNNVGDVYFYRWYPETQSYDAWVCRGIDREPAFYRLTEDLDDDNQGSMNDYGEIAWRRLVDPPHGQWGGGVRFLRRIRTGDAEFGGNISLVDLRSLVECMSGPGPIDRTPETSLCDCRFLDIDHDDDVDLADFARFQNAFTGDR